MTFESLLAGATLGRQAMAMSALMGIGQRSMELAIGVCLACSSEAEDHYPDLADCECHERGYN